MPELLTLAARDRVLAIYAHPDDTEISVGGSLRGWSEAGADVGLVIANQGDKGSADPDSDRVSLAAQRRDEVREASQVLGISEIEHLDIPDGELENSSDLRGRLVTAIRRFRPSVVIGPDPTAVFFGDSYVNHRDHRELGWAVLDACAPAAGSPHYFADAGPAHLVPTLLLSGTLEPDAWVDITATVEAKSAAVRQHRSQLAGVASVDEIVRDRAADAGRVAGCEYAEAFRRLRLG